MLLAARLTALKGHLVLIEAARQLALEGLTDTLFILAGDADGKDRYVGAIDSAIAKAGLEGVVRGRLLRGHAGGIPRCRRRRGAVDRAGDVWPGGRRGAGDGDPVVVSDLGAAPETVLATPAVDAARRTAGAFRPVIPPRWLLPCRRRCRSEHPRGMPWASAPVIISTPTSPTNRPLARP